MRVTLFCPLCQRAASPLILELLPKNDSVYEIDCPKGHRFPANILLHDFQKLFEVAINALADDYYREAVGSFAASYERFMELFTRIVMKANGVAGDELDNGWKIMSRQSERQLGAFIILFVLEFGSKPPLLANAQVELRNNVVHKGYFPTKAECMRYGTAVMNSIRKTIGILDSSKKHRSELSRSIEDQGDLCSKDVKVHVFPSHFIWTNRAQGNDNMTIEEMLDYSARTRGRLE